MPYVPSLPWRLPTKPMAQSNRPVMLERKSSQHTNRKGCSAIHQIWSDRWKNKMFAKSVHSTFQTSPLRVVRSFTQQWEWYIYSSLHKRGRSVRLRPCDRTTAAIPPVTPASTSVYRYWYTSEPTAHNNVKVHLNLGKAYFHVQNNWWEKIFKQYKWLRYFLKVRY